MGFRVELHQRKEAPAPKQGGRTQKNISYGLLRSAAPTMPNSQAHTVIIKISNRGRRRLTVKFGLKPPSSGLANPLEPAVVTLYSAVMLKGMGTNRASSRRIAWGVLAEVAESGNRGPHPVDVRLYHRRHFHLNRRELPPYVHCRFHCSAYRLGWKPKAFEC
jgi:hypothetical protein